MTRRRVFATWIGWWVLLYALWLWLVDTTQKPELFTGAAAAAISAALAAFVIARRRVRSRPDVAWTAHLPRLLWSFMLGCGVVLASVPRALVRRRGIEGRFRAARFEPGGGDPRSVARRAMTEVGISLSPNRWVAGIDRDEELLIVHELVRRTHEPVDSLELR